MGVCVLEQVDGESERVCMYVLEVLELKAGDVFGSEIDASTEHLSDFCGGESPCHVS